jgi:hypothetical protein
MSKFGLSQNRAAVQRCPCPDRKIRVEADGPGDLETDRSYAYGALPRERGLWVNFATLARGIGIAGITTSSLLRSLGS